MNKKAPPPKATSERRKPKIGEEKAKQPERIAEAAGHGVADEKVIEPNSAGIRAVPGQPAVFQRVGYGGKPARKVKGLTVYLSVDTAVRLDVHLAKQLVARQEKPEDRSAFIERSVIAMLDKEESPE